MKCIGCQDAFEKDGNGDYFLFEGLRVYTEAFHPGMCEACRRDEFRIVHSQSHAYSWLEPNGRSEPDVIWVGFIGSIWEPGMPSVHECNPRLVAAIETLTATGVLTLGGGWRVRRHSRCCNPHLLGAGYFDFTSCDQAVRFAEAMYGFNFRNKGIGITPTA